MKLVENWRDGWKWLSMHCMIVAGALQGAWVYVPDDMKQMVPHHLVSVLTIVLLGLGVVGRLVKQDTSNG